MRLIDANNDRQKGTIIVSVKNVNDDDSESDIDNDATQDDVDGSNDYVKGCMVLYIKTIYLKDDSVLLKMIMVVINIHGRDVHATNNDDEG